MRQSTFIVLYAWPRRIRHGIVILPAGDRRLLLVPSGKKKRREIEQGREEARLSTALTLLALLVLGLVPAVLVPQVRLEPPRPPVPATKRSIGERSASRPWNKKVAGE